MPGIETGAPDRTDTSRGFAASPNARVVARSRRDTCSSTSRVSASGGFSVRRNWMHASHAMVKPGGTGTPRLVISARLAPFPPSTRCMSLVPSALPSPKK